MHRDLRRTLDAVVLLLALSAAVPSRAAASDMAGFVFTFFGPPIIFVVGLGLLALAGVSPAKAQPDAHIVVAVITGILAVTLGPFALYLIRHEGLDAAGPFAGAVAFAVASGTFAAIRLGSAPPGHK